MLGLQLVLIASFAVPQTHGDFLAANMDRSVDPGVDFFAYANGGWLKKHPIPPAESYWGISNVIRDEVYAKLRTIDENAAKTSAKPGSDEQKCGDFWATGMDEAKAEKLGLEPLRAQLDLIDTVATAQNAIALGCDLQRLGVNAFFGFYVDQDEKNSDLEAVHLLQGGLGLPDRDYYFNTEAGVAKVRAEYVGYVQKILELAGDKDAATAAANIVAFETELATVSRKIEDQRDPEKNYNKMTVAGLKDKLTPSIDWAARFAGWHLSPKTVIVGQPEFFTGLEALLQKTPADTLRSYLKFHLVAEFAPYLNKEADAIDFHFKHEVLSGQKTPRPRWKRVLAAENGAIGFVLGRLYVKHYFPPSAKKRMSDLIEAVRKAYGKRIDRLDWMSAATKAKAHQKLAAITKKVGYPDKWKDYSKLNVSRNSFCENMMNAAEWSFDDMIAKFGKPVDRTEWGITPQTFDAYYNPSNNEMVFPAVAFDIPGLKPTEIDDAVMYGNAAGSWIGHEMTHGFDDQGRQFDAKGNLKDWWTPEDAKKFNARASVMVKQYNAYEPIKGIHVNGSATLGENIADYGGVLLGIDAFKETKAYKSGRKIGGLTPMQRYFLGFALSWLENERESSLRMQLLSDVHSPSRYRLIGPLSNIPEFYKAFNIKPGQPMRRPDSQRVHIW